MKYLDLCQNKNYTNLLWKKNKYIYLYAFYIYMCEYTHMGHNKKL